MKCRRATGGSAVLRLSHHIAPQPCIRTLPISAPLFVVRSSLFDLPLADMFAMPDAPCAVQLPWKPEVAWVPADPFCRGAPVAHAPRNVLKAQARDREDRCGERCGNGAALVPIIDISHAAIHRSCPCIVYDATIVHAWYHLYMRPWIQMKKAAALGLVPKSGVEVEFFLLELGGCATLYPLPAARLTAVMVGALPTGDALCPVEGGMESAGG